MLQKYHVATGLSIKDSLNYSYVIFVDSEFLWIDNFISNGKLYQLNRAFKVKFQHHIALVGFNRSDANTQFICNILI